MLKRFCQYCGTDLYDGCDCEKMAAEEMQQMIENYNNSPETHMGWAQQDTIDMYRRER
jgi:cyclophilin family peptidyl-prolyl cis-trans isomerase